MGRTRRKPLRATGDGVADRKGRAPDLEPGDDGGPPALPRALTGLSVDEGGRGVQAESEVARPGQNRVRSVQVSDDRAGAVGASRGEGRAVQAAAREMLIGAPPPPVFFGGRLWPSDELSAMAAGWLETLHASIPPEAELTALPLANHPEAIALFFALSSFPLPVVVLPADPRGWRTSPPLPPATPIFLPPSLAALAGAGVGTGLCTITLPDGGPPVGATPPIRFLATPGMVNFTSGSTGLPKPVFIRTRSFELQTAAIVSACQLEPGAPVAGSLPLAMHYGLGQALLLAAFLRSTLGLVERFEPRPFLRLLESHACAYWAGTPLMADMLARAPWSGPRPAVPPICHISAGRLSARVFQAFRARFGVTLRPNYGQTENGFITVDTGPEDEIRPSSVGRPAPGIDVRIGDDPRDPSPSGRLGRVWFKSPWYMDGYGLPPSAPDAGRSRRLVAHARPRKPRRDEPSHAGRPGRRLLQDVGGIPREPGRDRGRAHEPPRCGRPGRPACPVPPRCSRRRSRGECSPPRSRRGPCRCRSSLAALALAAGRCGDDAPAPARQRKAGPIRVSCPPAGARRRTRALDLVAWRMSPQAEGRPINSRGARVAR